MQVHLVVVHICRWREGLLAEHWTLRSSRESYDEAALAAALLSATFSRAASAADHLQGVKVSRWELDPFGISTLRQLDR
jgi:hypothetical protein